MKKIIKRLLKRTLPNNKPNFLIVGAQKSGTTSLHYYLSQHPKLVGSFPKELHFFSRDDNFKKGLKWYHKHFFDKQNLFKKGLYFESTPFYLYKENVAERIYKYNPNLKIIIVLRDPAKRAYSAWNMYRDFAKDSPKHQTNVKNVDVIKEFYSEKHFPSFEECFENELDRIKLNSPYEGHGVIRRGIYLPQIKKYHKLFGKNNVLILGFKDLIGNKQETLNDVLKFLEIPNSDWNFLQDRAKNVRSYPQKINPETEGKLKNFYASYNKELFEYLGKEINW